MRTAPLAVVTAFALALSACQSVYSAPAAQTNVAAEPAQVSQQTAMRPGAFIEAACGGCHAVEEPFLSPNPAAPTFAAIANSEGLTRESLASWLVDAHNYPEMMDFDLEPHHVEQIATYMASLKREDYVPAK